MYSYRIANRGSAPITAISIGYDYYHGVPELSETPMGWTLNGGIPEKSAKSPPGWTVELIPTEDTDKVNLVWNITEPHSAIKSDQSLSGFSVLVPSPDSSYANSHWTLSLDRANSAAYSGTLQGDIEPMEHLR
jgi:hypothetical protein